MYGQDKIPCFYRNGYQLCGGNKQEVGEDKDGAAAKRFLNVEVNWEELDHVLREELVTHWSG